MTTVVIALGSNLGDREYHLRRAVNALGAVVRIVRISRIRESDPMDAPPGSPRFLNMALLGYTHVPPQELLGRMLAIESALGRAPRRLRNEPRIIDLDLILYGACRLRTPTLTLPHPRAHLRPFVLTPLADLGSHLRSSLSPGVTPSFFHLA